MFIEYKFEYAGTTRLLKADQHRAGFEQYYHLRKNKASDIVLKYTVMPKAIAKILLFRE